MYALTIEALGRDIRCSGLTREEAYLIIAMFSSEACDIWVSFDGGPAWNFPDHPYL